MSEPLFQQKLFRSSAGYTNPSQQTNRQALRNGPITWVTDLAKMPGPAGWFSKEVKVLKESDVPWMGTGLFIANYPLATPAPSSQSSVTAFIVAFLVHLQHVIGMLRHSSAQSLGALSCCRCFV